ncbi:MAG: DNA replication and repair protein RecF, partial [Clostridia bacterium]|nr:DNA replication and repair protein RecF [Clostridia bacterium]
FHKVNSEYPVLLLDDVFSELDEKRRDYIMSKTQAGQVIITSCYEEGDRFPNEANIIRPFE